MVVVDSVLDPDQLAKSSHRYGQMPFLRSTWDMLTSETGLGVDSSDVRPVVPTAVVLHLSLLGEDVGVMEHPGAVVAGF